MAISESDNQLPLVASSGTTSYEELLEAQKELISKQICELQKIVSTQCRLTGVNPLSHEMAAGALSIKIGKRPRDLLNPKAIKYMQSIFSVKDEISKKETRAISSLFGLTATQVRDFFNGQRSRVRRFIRLSREKAIQCAEGVQEQDGSLSSNLDVPNQPIPLNSVDPPSIETPCSMQDEALLDTNVAEKHFIANIFNSMRKEETFTGQVKLMEWILQIQNASVLNWFLTNGGVMILASWLSQAAMEEQTTVLHFILRVLCHLPLQKALPAHMSAVLQSVNKLRFYRGSDISNRAKGLLSRWSKLFAKSQAIRRHNLNVSSVDVQNEMLLKQSIGEIMENESLESKVDNPEAMYTLQENPENFRSQSTKLLTGASDDSNTKLLRGLSSSHTRERRKVQLVEQPGQKPASRGPLVTRVVSKTQGRPLSADDIQKAKMRAQFMRSKYGESYVSPQVKIEVPQAKAHVHPKLEEYATTSSSSIISSVAKPHILPKIEEHASTSSMISLAEKAHVQPKIEEHRMVVKPISAVEVQEVAVHCKEIVDSEEPLWKKCKRLQVSWVIPPEMKIDKEWSVCSGENSKEIDIQNNRIKREKEVFYITNLEIPPNPKEPWDREMDYDDSLTPEIPTDQLPDDDDNMVAESSGMAPDHTSNYAVGSSTKSENSNRNTPEADFPLLTALLQNPAIVFALTDGQGGSLTMEQTMRLLDAIKENGARGGSIVTLVNLLVNKKAEEKVDHTSNYAVGSSTKAENNNRNTADADFPLLTALLQNPAIVSALTAGQGGTLTMEHMVRLCDAINANAARGGSIDTIVNELVNKKAEEKVEVSLPSPTPSSEPVTSGWRAENQFSRQSVTVNGDAYAIPGVGFQRTGSPTPATMTPPLSRQAIGPVEHQRFPDLVSDRRSIPANLTQKPISPPLHHRLPDMVPDRRNILAAGHELQSNAYFLPEVGGSQIQPQQHMASESWRSPVQSWTGRENLGTSSYSPVEHTYNAYGTREFAYRGPSHVGPSRVRNRGYPDDPGFESWSPNNSPVRGHEYVDAWDYSDPHDRGYNYRPEMSRMQHDHSRYRDRGGRNDGSWWRDRRR